MVPDFDRVIFQIPFDGEHPPAKDVVGSKAHNLMRMARCGLDVPPGFVISTELCRSFLAQGEAALQGLDDALAREVARLGRITGRQLGDFRRPLLLSVRSGAAISMPGMMETVLNIGLSRSAMNGLVRMTGNPRLAKDCRRRLVQQYGEVVHGIAPSRFSEKIHERLAATRATDLDELSTSDLAGVCRDFEEIFEAETGKAFPDDPFRQLYHSIEAVLRSWSSERAQSYRSLNAISDMLGTAVTVQVMAFGNIGPNSGSGVGFTRNPADGTDALYVDFLGNAQGEDVVAGRHSAAGLEELERRAPSAHEALLAAKPLLEAEFRDMQDFEFTVEEGRLLMLQARSGKRTPLAALRIAKDLVREGITAPAEALKTLEGLDLDAIEETKLCIPPDQQPLVSGTPASTGVVVGAAAFDPARIADLKAANDTIILVRQSAETSDIAALAETDGLVTVQGARTSHAAVVARQIGKPCVVACSGLSIEASGRRAHFGSEIVNEGDIIAVDAASGRIYKGRYDIVRERPTALIEEIKAWSDTSKAGPIHRKRHQLSVQRQRSPRD